MTIRNWIVCICLLHLLAPIGIGGEPPPLFEKDRPDWEIKFADAGNAVLSVMPGESKKTFHDPITGKDVQWEQDVYCPTFTVADGKLHCVYRAFGDDGQWRLGSAWSDDGVHFTRSPDPLLHAKPEVERLQSLGGLKNQALSYGDPHVIADRDGNFYLYFDFFHYADTTSDQQLAVATSRDLKKWALRNRVFASTAPLDRAVISERSPWRLLTATVVSQLEGDRLVAAKIQGKYWMYFNCYATKGPYCLCMATSDDLVDWKVLRDGQGHLVNPLPPRPGQFDSWYTDPVAALLRQDGILLIYNGVNAEPDGNGDRRLKYYAHYPAQALFDKDEPPRLLKRSSSPFKGGDEELEKQPIVFWTAPLYEAWSLVPFRGELLLYWNHSFGRRSVGLWKAPMPADMIDGQNGNQGRNDPPSSPDSNIDLDQWYEPGTLVPADENDATDVLALTIHVDGLISEVQIEFEYRKLTKRERVHLIGRGLGAGADDDKDWYSLSLDEKPSGPITGVELQIAIHYSGSWNGKKFDDNETIVVPVGKESKGKSGILTFKSEWKKESSRKNKSPQ